MQEICQAACNRWDLKKIAIAHRTGTVLIGEASVIIVASSPHRRDALEVRRLALLSHTALPTCGERRVVVPNLCCVPVMCGLQAIFPLCPPRCCRPVTGRLTSSRPACPSGRRSSLPVACPGRSAGIASYPGDGPAFASCSAPLSSSLPIPVLLVHAIECHVCRRAGLEGERGIQEAAGVRQTQRCGAVGAGTSRALQPKHGNCGGVTTTTD